MLYHEKDVCCGKILQHMKQVPILLAIFIISATFLSAQKLLTDRPLDLSPSAKYPPFMDFGRVGSRGVAPRLDSIQSYLFNANSPNDSVFQYTSYFRSSGDTVFYTSYYGSDRVHPVRRTVIEFNSLYEPAEAYAYKFRTHEIYNKDLGVWETDQFYRYYWNKTYHNQADSSYFIVFTDNAQTLYSEEWCQQEYDPTHKLITASNCSKKQYLDGTGTNQNFTAKYDAENRLIYKNTATLYNPHNFLRGQVENFTYVIDTTYAGIRHEESGNFLYLDSTKVVETTTINSHGKTIRKSHYKWYPVNQVYVWKPAWTEDFTYDAEGRLISIDYKNPGDETKKSGREFTYEFDNLYSTMFVYYNYDTINGTGILEKNYFFYTDTTSKTIQPTIKISPNPATSIIQAVSDVHFRSAKLYDIQGRLIYSVSDIGKYSISLDRRGFPNGVYIFHLEMANGAIVTRKIVFI